MLYNTWSYLVIFSRFLMVNNLGNYQNYLGTGTRQDYCWKRQKKQRLDYKLGMGCDVLTPKSSVWLSFEMIWVVAAWQFDTSRPCEGILLGLVMRVTLIGQGTIPVYKSVIKWEIPSISDLEALSPTSFVNLKWISVKRRG